MHGDKRNEYHMGRSRYRTRTDNGMRVSDLEWKKDGDIMAKENTTGKRLQTSGTFLLLHIDRHQPVFFLLSFRCCSSSVCFVV